MRAARSGSSLAHRDLMSAVGREGCAVPFAPSFAETHPGKVCHEVEFRRPDIAKGRGEDLRLAVDEEVVVRPGALGGDVDFVEAQMAGAEVEGNDGLSWLQPLPWRDHDF